MKGPLIPVAILAVLPAAPGAEAPRPPGRRPSEQEVRPAPADVDLLRIRNIFRFADTRLEDSTPPPTHPPFDVPPDVTAPAPPRGPRLVGLVERAGSLVAALSVEGEVVLLAEGQSARGYIVVEIGEDTVRLRGPEGTEESLQLP